MQPSGSRLGQSNGVHAYFDENSEPDDEGYPPQTSKLRDLRHPAKSLFRSESDVDVTIHSDEESDLEEDYHMVTGANKQLQRQSSQNSQLLNDHT